MVSQEFQGVVYVGLACATIDPLIAGLICHATGQLQVLKRNLQHLDEYVDKQVAKTYGREPTAVIKSKVIYDKIKECVLHYNVIANFVDEYEQCFSSAIFCQFMESIIVIGICCLQIIKLQAFNLNMLIMVNYLCFLLLQVYFYCYYGTMLIEENNTITNAIYMSKWYDYNGQSRRALLILMERTKRSMHVSAGKVLDLSLETFTMILKRSYSLLVVLKNY
ncbi:odorant receptor Or1-like [Tenebrio molitor]|uniref:odorant receptor Or1-like n=1 Tax=Tenebrio molitor TaxID=7067 RepID=UPI003624A789